MQNTFALVCCVAAVCLQGALAQQHEVKPIKAIAVLSGSNGVIGNVTLTQNGCGEPVQLTVQLTGLKEGNHGFHVHEKGDLSQGCASLAAHFNPDKLNHGAPNKDIRHVGDLGNVIANNQGIVSTTITDSLVSLTGKNSVIGRGIIVHEDVDDLGLGNNADSLKTGNAGGRFACGVIGLAMEEDEEMPVCGSTASALVAATTFSLISSLLLIAIRG